MDLGPKERSRRAEGRSRLSFLYRFSAYQYRLPYACFCTYNTMRTKATSRLLHHTLHHASGVMLNYREMKRMKWVGKIQLVLTRHPKRSLATLFVHNVDGLWIYIMQSHGVMGSMMLKNHKTARADQLCSLYFDTMITYRVNSGDGVIPHSNNTFYIQPDMIYII